MGMLFDHGCDAMTSVISCSNLMRMFQMGHSPYNLFVTMISIFPFYFVTLESFYTGEMNFPPINGVDEGSVVLWACAMASGYFGNDIWLQKVSVPLFEEPV